MLYATMEFLPPGSAAFYLSLLLAIAAVVLALRLFLGESTRLSRRWSIRVLRAVFFALLLVILCNPVRVTEQPGPIVPAQVFFLLDASQSMAVADTQGTRWQRALTLVDGVIKAVYENAAVEINLYRFGKGLKAIDSLATLTQESHVPAAPTADVQVSADAAAQVVKAAESASATRAMATDPDTQLLGALSQVSSRFGRRNPAAVVVCSDGRTRDESLLDQVAETFAKIGVPVHTVPVGTIGRGDVNLLSLVIPNSARNHSEVSGEVFVRSYGFAGQATEIQLHALDERGERSKRLTAVPVTLQDGIQSISVSFQVDDGMRRIEATISQQRDEISSSNNRVTSELTVTREKIRVLYLNGDAPSASPRIIDGRVVLAGPGNDLQQGLQADDDIECIAISVDEPVIGLNRGMFPTSEAEMYAYDVVILSDVSSRSLSEDHIRWIESWVRLRGGGFAMVGGRNSFSNGQWTRSRLEKLLPVNLSDESHWRTDIKTKLEIPDAMRSHPIVRFTDDEAMNRGIIESIPEFEGVTDGLVAKRDMSQVIGVAQPTGSAGVTIGQYGKGRTMAIAMSMTGGGADAFLKWGREGDGQYFSRFWRNAVYWLSEQSFVGRRRLVASTDKRYYAPGDTIRLAATAYNEKANQTTAYRLVVVIEPESADDIDSDYSSVRWPNSVPRSPDVEGPLIGWGEEFEIPLVRVEGRDAFQIDLALADALPTKSAEHAFRLELTAFEGATQVDSRSLPVQILADPFEQRNPYPHPELLAALSAKTGGQVLPDEGTLSQVLQKLPVERGPSQFQVAPAWSRGWLLSLLVAILSLEWHWRRTLGLA